jgi:biopolymer transport protein TolQ
MNPSLSFIDLIADASVVVKFVMFILLAASVYGWYLIAKLEMINKKMETEDHDFERMFWSGIELKTVFQNAQINSNKCGHQAIFYEGFAEFVKLRQKGVSREERLAGTERMLRISISRQQIPLEQGLPLLASIGSVSPYIGLLGTVWGIMNAFMGLSQMQQASLAAVAPGIAEALIATAIGLFAAIPAVLAFNRYSAKSEAVFQQRVLFAEELTGLLQREAS